MFAAFTYRDFRVQWFGACTSSIGTWTQTAAQNWMVLSLTGSAFFLGLDAFLQQLPIMLFTLIGGVLADRRDRRRTLLASQYIQMATAATLGVLVMLRRRSDLADPRCCRSCTGLAQAFGGPAYQSLIPSLVDKKDLPNAVALNSIQFNIARVLGPLLFGATLAVGAIWGFAEPQAMAVCFLAQRAVVSGRDLRADVAAREAHPADAGTSGCSTSCGADSSYVRHHGSLVGLIVLAATTTFLGFSVLTFLPLFTQERLSRGRRHLQSPAGVLGRRFGGRRARSSRGSASSRGWADVAAGAGGVRPVDRRLRVVAHAVAERHPAVPHRRGADGGVLDASRRSSS